MWPFNRKPEQRIASSDTYLGEFLGARWQARADIEKASGHAVAHRCISVMAETLASVPLKLYQHSDNGGRDSADSHPLYGVLHDQTSPTLSAFEAREWLIANILMHGNAFAKVERNGRGQVIALHPMIAGTVTVERLGNGKLRYKHALQNGSNETLLQDEVLHLRYRTLDGVLGQSPIQIAAATFGLALSEQNTAGSAAENSFRPAGVISLPDKIGVDVRDALTTKFEDKFVGSLKANGVMILDGAATFTPLSFSSKDSEFLESRKLSNLDICRVFGVPPSVAGIVDSANYSNSQEESKALVQRCLAPMARRIEQAMNIALLTPESRKQFFIEHDLAGLLRGDLVQRYNAYAVGRNGGWLNVNQIRAFENMSNIGPAGDTYSEPLNMGIVGANDNRNKIDESKVA